MVRRLLLLFRAKTAIANEPDQLADEDGRTPLISEDGHTPLVTETPT